MEFHWAEPSQEILSLTVDRLRVPVAYIFFLTIIGPPMNIINHYINIQAGLCKKYVPQNSVAQTRLFPNVNRCPTSGKPILTMSTP